MRDCVDASRLLDFVSVLPHASYDGLRSFVREYLEAPFGGRVKTIELLDHWFADPNNSRAVLAAEAGRGKSALLVQWAAKLSVEGKARVAFVPVSIRFHTALGPTFARMLRLRLAGLAGKTVALQATSIADEVAEIAALLREDQPEDEPPLLVILDGLDEAVGWTVGKGISIPNELGRGVHILASARVLADCDADAWATKLGFQGRATLFSLPLLGRDAVEDVLFGAGKPLQRQAGRVDILNEVYRLTEGDPLLLRLVVSALGTDINGIPSLVPKDLERLRSGLDGFFEHWWDEQRRQWGSAAPLEEPHVRRFLHLLASALGPLSQADIDALIGTKGTKVPAALSRFILGDGQTRGFVFSHPRFALFLRERMSVEEQRAYDEQFVSYGRTIVTKLRQNELESADVPEYVLQHHVAHLDRSGGNEDAYDELIHHRWLEAWEALEGSFGGFLRCLDRAFASVDATFVSAETQEIRGRAMVRQLRYHEIREWIAQLNLEVRREARVLLLEEGIWTPAMAIERAKLLPDEDRAEVLKQILAYIPDERLWEISTMLRDWSRTGESKVYDALRIDLAQRFVDKEQWSEADEVLVGVQSLDKHGAAMAKVAEKIPLDFGSASWLILVSNLQLAELGESTMSLPTRVDVALSILKRMRDTEALAFLIREFGGYADAWYAFEDKHDALPEMIRTTAFAHFAKEAVALIGRWDPEERASDFMIYGVPSLLARLSDQDARDVLDAIERWQGRHPLQVWLSLADHRGYDMGLIWTCVQCCLRVYGADEVVRIVLDEPVCYILINLAGILPDPARSTLLEKALEVWPGLEVGTFAWDRIEPKLELLDPQWHLRFIEQAPPIIDSMSAFGEPTDRYYLLHARIRCACRFDHNERKALLRGALETFFAETPTRSFRRCEPYTILAALIELAQQTPGAMTHEECVAAVEMAHRADIGRYDTGFWTQHLVKLAHVIPIDLLPILQEEAMHGLRVWSRGHALAQGVQRFEHENYQYERPAEGLELLAAIAARLPEAARMELRQSLFTRAIAGELDIWKAGKDEGSLWRNLFDAQERKEMLGVSLAKARRFGWRYWPASRLDFIAAELTGDARRGIAQTLVNITRQTPPYFASGLLRGIAKLLPSAERAPLAEVLRMHIERAEKSLDVVRLSYDLLAVAPDEEKPEIAENLLATMEHPDREQLDCILASLPADKQFVITGEKLMSWERDRIAISLDVRLQCTAPNERRPLIETALANATDSPQDLCDLDRYSIDPYVTDADYERIAELWVALRMRNPDAFREHHWRALRELPWRLSLDALQRYAAALLFPSSDDEILDRFMYRSWIFRAVMLGDRDLARKLAALLTHHDNMHDRVAALVQLAEIAPQFEPSAVDSDEREELESFLGDAQSGHLCARIVAEKLVNRPGATWLAKYVVQNVAGPDNRLRVWGTLWSTLTPDTRAELTPALMATIEEAIVLDMGSSIFRDAIELMPLNLLARAWQSRVGAAGGRTRGEERLQSYFATFCADCAAMRRLGGETALVGFAEGLCEVNAWFCGPN